MRKHIILLIFTLTSPYIFAQNSCDIVLNSRAFDTNNLEASEKTISAKRDEFCKGEYASAHDAQKSAESSGLNLGYEGMEIGGSQQNSASRSHYDVKSSNFCSKTKNDFFRDSKYKQSSVATAAALSIWLECVKHANGDVYAEWALTKDSRSIKGKFHFGPIVKGEIKKPKISGINLVPVDFPNADLVCTIMGKTFTAAELNLSGIILDNVETEFVCTKVGASMERDLEVSFVSSEALGFMSITKPIETCSIKRNELCGIASYNIKQSEWCGSTPNIGTGAVCGVATWKTGKGEVCGYDLTHSVFLWPKRVNGSDAQKLSLCQWKGYDMTSGRIGFLGAPGRPPEPNNPEFLECGRYKTCANEAFGSETYKECRDVSFGSTYNVCEHEKHGINDFKECKINDSTGKLCTLSN